MHLESFQNEESGFGLSGNDILFLTKTGLS